MPQQAPGPTRASHGTKKIGQIFSHFLKIRCYFMPFGDLFYQKISKMGKQAIFFTRMYFAPTITSACEDHKHFPLKVIKGCNGCFLHTTAKKACTHRSSLLWHMPHIFILKRKIASNNTNLLDFCSHLWYIWSARSMWCPREELQLGDLILLKVFFT